jgi:cytochrome c oxidase subunit 2
MTTTFALLIEALGIAPNASEHGYAIDSMLEMLHWFMLALFLGWGTFYACTLFLFRSGRNPRANYVGTTSHLPTKLEGGVLVLEIVLLLAFAAPIWAARVDEWPSGTDVVQVRAVGQQFSWSFQYQGQDNEFGQRVPGLVSGSNPLGLDRTSEGGADDVVSINEMHVPVNRPCIVEVMSKDVIHNFCVPNMRVAQDAIPGTKIPLHFIPIKTGTYEIVCAQLCGSGHASMRAILQVDSEADYEKWLKDTAPKPEATGKTASVAPAAPSHI